MLRNRLLAFVVLGVIVGAIAVGCAKTPPPQDTAADKTKLETDATSWFGFFANADSEGMANLYAEDAIIMPPDGPAVSGRQAIKSYLGTMAAQVKAGGMLLKNDAVTGTDVSGDIGWISGTYSVTDSTGAVLDSGNYLSAHHRTNGVWLYTRDIWNSNRPPATRQPEGTGTKTKK